MTKMAATPIHGKNLNKSQDFEKRRHQVFSNVFDWILFILAGNDNMHERLDEFEIWLDSTTDYGVISP